MLNKIIGKIYKGGLGFMNDGVGTCNKAKR